jgi:RES domain-containing protein
VKRRALSDRGLVRLVPAAYHKPPVLRGLVDSDAEMEILAQIEGLTSARLEAERGRNLHLDRRELAWRRRARDLQVYGHSHINAAFAYTRAGGNRFNDETRGAWYCAWEVLTCIAEVAFHKTRELTFVGVFHERTQYVELLADVIGEVPDLADEPDHPALAPDPAVGYPEGQALATRLRLAGEMGLIYPSVRAAQTDCLVIFEPAAIRNVRPGARWEIIWDGGPEYSVHGL